MKRAARLLITAFVAMWTRSAAAGDADTAAADALFRAGRAALASGDIALACSRFAESYRLDPAVGTVMNLADCEERAGRLDVALAHFAEARDALAPWDFRMRVVEKRIADLDKRVPRLTLVSSAKLPRETTLECDGVELGVGSLGVALPVAPGTHTCTMHVPRHADGRVDVELKEGEHLCAAIEPGASVTEAKTLALAPEPPTRRQAQPSSPPPQRRGPNRTLVYVLGAVGVTGMIVGGTSGVLALRAGNDYRAHCTPECDQAGADAASTGRTMVVVSPIAFGIGLAGLGAAAMVFAFGNRAKAAMVQIAPTGLSVALSF